MTKTVAAVYDDGVSKPEAPLPLPDKSPVLVTGESDLVVAEDAGRQFWLKASAEGLTKTWDNPEGDVFNELLLH